MSLVMITPPLRSSGRIASLSFNGGATYHFYSGIEQLTSNFHFTNVKIAIIFQCSLQIFQVFHCWPTIAANFKLRESKVVSCTTNIAHCCYSYFGRVNIFYFVFFPCSFETQWESCQFQHRSLLHQVANNTQGHVC